ncbi:MAG: AbrB/MazE/SpoVT family DNA-binding domain-containing protein [Chloroflexi bacterium]|nr:AbrB/MazE/SpoVT family DNA-binding domain-containing protein [Chloroflexota bacterium]
MTTIVVTTKGQIVIPAPMRKRLKIKKGTRLFIEENGGGLVIRPMTPDYFESISGILPGKGKLTRALLEERAKDKQKEDAG